MKENEQGISCLALPHHAKLLACVWHWLMFNLSVCILISNFQWCAVPICLMLWRIFFIWFARFTGPCSPATRPKACAPVLFHVACLSSSLTTLPILPTIFMIFSTVEVHCVTFCIELCTIPWIIAFKVRCTCFHTCCIPFIFEEAFFSFVLTFPINRTILPWILPVVMTFFSFCCFALIQHTELLYVGSTACR